MLQGDERCGFSLEMRSGLHLWNTLIDYFVKEACYSFLKLFPQSSLGAMLLFLFAVLSGQLLYLK